MLTLLVILAIAVVLLIAAAVATSEREEVLTEVSPDRADLGLPVGRLTAADVDGLRFGLAFRGYRMSEVDDALDRISTALTERDNRIAELEGALAAVLEPAVAVAEAGLAAQDTPYGGKVPEPEAVPAPVVPVGLVEPAEPEELDPGVDEVVSDTEQPWTSTATPVAPTPAAPTPAVASPAASFGLPAAPAPAQSDTPEPEPEPEPVQEPASWPASVEPVPAEATQAEPVPAEPVQTQPGPDEPVSSESSAPLPERPEPTQQSPWTSQAVVPDAPPAPPAEPAQEPQQAAVPVVPAPQPGLGAEDDLAFPEVAPAEPTPSEGDDERPPAPA